jgi:hypothetical protein
MPAISASPPFGSIRKIEIRARQLPLTPPQAQQLLRQIADDANAEGVNMLPVANLFPDGVIQKTLMMAVDDEDSASATQYQAWQRNLESAQPFHARHASVNSFLTMLQQFSGQKANQEKSLAAMEMLQTLAADIARDNHLPAVTVDVFKQPDNPFISYHMTAPEKGWPEQGIFHALG